MSPIWLRGFGWIVIDPRPYQNHCVSAYVTTHRCQGNLRALQTTSKTDQCSSHDPDVCDCCNAMSAATASVPATTIAPPPATSATSVTPSNAHFIQLMQAENVQSNGLLGSFILLVKRLPTRQSPCLNRMHLHEVCWPLNTS
jgi:hypothetical protein